jgi:tetraacyldisaccharide 4'-kinase
MAGIPQCSARYNLLDARPVSGGLSISFDSLKDCRLLAFAGIAEPASFFESLRTIGLNVVATLCFPDHAGYNHVQLDEIVYTMKASTADLAITTEKDGVKLIKLPAELCDKIVLARLSLIIDQSSLLQDTLRKTLLKQP